MLYKILFNKNVDIKKRTYIWNFISSVVYSLQAALFLLIVKRVSGDEVSGVFIILYTVAQTLTSVGNFGMRNYQVSDVKNDYSFSQYYTSRIITCSLMMICNCVYAFYKGLSFSSVLLLLYLSGNQCVGCLEDVYHGEIQKQGRLDVASIFMSIRLMLSILLFFIVFIITSDVNLASLITLVFSFCLLLYFNGLVKKDFSLYRKWNSLNVHRLLGDCLPIFAGSFLYNYLINAPKYSIDKYCGGSVQTIFNILFMPIFVVNILSMFIYKPIIYQMGEWWNYGEKNKFVKSIVRQLIYILLIVFFVVIMGNVIGLKLLEIIYGAKLMQYRFFFSLLLGFGGIAAIDFFLCTVLTIMRKQYSIISGYIVGLIVSIIFTDILVKKKGLYGAGYAYGIIMTTVLVFYLLSIVFSVNRKKQ